MGIRNGVGAICTVPMKQGEPEDGSPSCLRQFLRLACRYQDGCIVRHLFLIDEWG